MTAALELERAELVRLLAASHATNAALRRELVELRAEMAAVAGDLAAQYDDAPTPDDVVTAIELPVRRRVKHETLRVPADETMRDVVDGELWRGGS